MSEMDALVATFVDRAGGVNPMRTIGEVRMAAQTRIAG
jgi:hypothetical protein